MIRFCADAALSVRSLACVRRRPPRHLCRCCQIEAPVIIYHDWEARFRLVFPNGWEARIFAAHDFKGHSQWNPLHGPMKAGAMGPEADIYVCGHRHNWATFTYENASRGREQTFIRVRGYKFLDDYARRMGIIEQEGGCSLMTVFDPGKRSITTFSDVERGAEFLTMVRKAS